MALLVGFAVSHIDVSPGSPLAPLAFQGTADDARTLLSNITSSVITVIALVLGLTVVALQLSSTQFSPRLLRNFLRDRPNQIVLSTFIATFVYAAAGLYTVGLAVGSRTEDFPRLAVSGALVLMFASLAMVVYFADHLAHSIQVDAIGKRVEHDTLAVVHGRMGSVEEIAPTPPPWSVPLTAATSGYLQTVHPELLLPLASRTPGPHPAPRPGRRAHRRRHCPRLDVDPHPGPPASRTRRSFATHWTLPSASASNAPRNRTPRSASGNSSTWPARPCPRR